MGEKWRKEIGGPGEGRTSKDYSGCNQQDGSGIIYIKRMECHVGSSNSRV